MATISAAIRIQDGFSSSLRSMSSALQVTLNSFEAVQRASGNAVDVSAIEAARRELARTEQAFSDIEAEILQANVQQRDFNGSINEGFGSANKLLGVFLSLVAAYASISGLRGLLDLSDEFVSTSARLDYINDGLQTTQQLQDLISESASRTFSPYLQSANFVAKLANNAKEAFSSTQEIVAFSELLSKSFANANTNAEGIASATLQLTQALGSGVLRGEELNAVLESAPGIVQNIEKYLGITRKELRKIASDGEITADIVKQSLFTAAADINEQFSQLPIKFSQLFIRFKDEAIFAFEGILIKLNEIANNTDFQNFLGSITQSLTVVADVSVSALNLLADVAGFVYSAWDLIGPVVTTATGLIIAYTVALVAAQTATLITAGYHSVMAAALTYQTGATFAATAAQHGLNAALLANPIGLIIAAIIALIGLFYLMVGAVNYFTGTSTSATGLIAGAFSFLFTSIINGLISIYNLFAIVSEFLLNVFQNPVYSVKKLFVGLVNSAIDLAQSMIGSFDSAATNLANLFIQGANKAIGGINKLIDAINQIPGVNLKGFGELEQKVSLSADLTNLKSTFSDFVNLGPEPENYKTINKLEYRSATDAAVKGYNVGANLFKGTPSAGSAGSGIDLDKVIGDSLKNATKNSGADKEPKASKAAKSTAKNTKKLADTATILSDDLKYLRDLSEREAINRYTTGQITIDARSENTINSGMDLDGIVNGLAEKLEEAVEVVAEGSAFDV